MPRLLFRAMFTFVSFAAIAAATPGSAAADATQLCRGFTSVVLAPTDVVLGPFISARDTYGALTVPGEPYKVWISYLPSYPFFLGIQTGGAVLRVVAGAFEILPGLVGLFSEESAPPLFRQQDEARQIFSGELGPCPLRVGSSYWSILSGSEPQ